MNDQTFVNAVVDALKEATDNVQTLAKKRDEIDAEIKSGKYSRAGVSELMDKAWSIKREIQAAKDSGFAAARAIIADYKAEIEREDQLNPADLTDDIKLLSMGVPLLKRDIMGLLERNAGNRTMTQIILRYAKEHDIDTGMIYHNTADHARAVEQYWNILPYYEKWMDTDRAYDMLNKFFGV